jgi:N-acetylneuraminic acid mutarotase
MKCTKVIKFSLNSYRMRIVLVGFVFSGFLNMVSVCSALEYVWTRKADMPTGRSTQTSAVVNGKIYVIGGATSQPNAMALATVEEYDPVTNTWTRKADMPTALADMVGSSPVVDGKIYVIGLGGIYAVDWSLLVVEEYDPSTDTWTRKADMPTPRWLFATVDFGGKVYAIGGAPNNSYRGLTVVEQYDPITDTWTRKADMPMGLYSLCAKVVNGKIYAFGGRTGQTATYITFEYDPSTDIWTRKASMPVATSQMGSVVLGDKIIVIGGWHWSLDYPYTTMQVYDPQTDTWTREADVPFLRAMFSAEVVNNRIYVIGGTDRPHPCSALSTVYEFGPLLDFNGDGIVDCKDMCIMVDNWHTDDSLCDIAPAPFGDGIVDVEDLKVLAEHLFKEVNDPTLIAHWTLDEAEGIITADSVSETGYTDGIVIGDPVWQPTGGQVEGALQLDGVDDYIFTNPVLNPADGAFSVFAWIKGGAPGQAIISQTDGDGTGETWLGTDTVGGNLITGLIPQKIGWVSPRPLVSESVITDGQWHRIGLVWDGSYRILYVDDIEVAKDTTAQNPLKSADGGLHIGASNTLATGTYFSGLIDDIRIYNRAVSP